LKLIILTLFICKLDYYNEGQLAKHA